jgi:FkbM family methyltransferase
MNKKRIIKILEILGNFFTRLNYQHKSERFKNLYDFNICFFFNDKISREISIDGIFEKEEIQLILKKLKSRNFFIDVGANIGNHSIFYSKYFSKVLSFEAHPLTFEVLRMNTKKLKNVKIYNYALSNKANHLYFDYKSSKNVAGTSLKSKGDLKVKSKIFDNEFKNIKNIDLIKIDVEGHESKVIEGMKYTLIKNDPLLMLEFDAINFKNSLLIKRLRDLGFKYFYFFSQTFNEKKLRLKNLPILILKIFFLGFNENKVSINNISEFDKSINYIKDNILCSKKPVIL